MNELDKLFKDKLHDREFEFKDSYWLAAEELIEQEEHNQRNRGGLWWKLGLLLLVVTAIGYFGFNRQSTASVSQTETSADKQSIDNKTTDIYSASNDSEGFDDTDINEQQTSNTEDQKQNVGFQANSKSQVSDSNTKAFGVTKPVDLTNAPLKKGTAIPKGTANTNQQNTLDNAPKLDAKVIEIQPAVMDTLEQKLKADKKKKKEIAAAIEQESTPLEEETALVETLALLETIPSLEMPAADCEGCFDFKKVKQKRLSFGLNAEGLVYPFDEQQSWWAGGALGLIARYKLNRHIYLRSGINYSLTIGNNKDFIRDINTAELVSVGDDNALKFQSEIQYDFGGRLVETFFTPESFHSFEIPLFLQFRIKKHIIESGFQMNLIAGVRGRSVSKVSLFPWEIDQIRSTHGINENSEKRWMPKENYKKISNSIALGYKYLLNSKLSVGFNAYYRLGKINNVDSTFDNTTTTFTRGGLDFLEETFTPERLHFRFGVNWYFK